MEKGNNKKMLNTPSRDSVITKVDGYSLLAQKLSFFWPTVSADKNCSSLFILSIPSRMAEHDYITEPSSATCVGCRAAQHAALA